MSVGAPVTGTVWNGMMLQDLVSNSDVRRCTCHRHSLEWYDAAGSRLEF